MRHLIASALAIAAVSAAASAASAAMFDPAGSSNPTISFTSIDMAPGNALLTDLTPSNITGVTYEFNLYYQARVQALLGANGMPVYYPGGANPELTVIAGFHGGMTSVGNIAQATLLPGLPNFVKVFSDASNNANDAAGTGFDDGTMIYSALATSGVGSLVSAPGVLAGGLLFVGNSLSVNTPYLGSPMDVATYQATSTLTFPFDSVPMSAQFTNGVGTVNPGLLDVQVQADGSLTFVPEPASLSLLALGGLALLRRRA